MSTIISFSDAKISRDRRNYRPGACRHLHLALDDEGEIVRCSDCQVQVGAYWALTMLIERFQRERAALDARDAGLKELASRTLHLKAARVIESIWRGRKMAPLCPQCNEAILPEDGMGSSMASLDMVTRLRAARRGRS